MSKSVADRLRDAARDVAAAPMAGQLSRSQVSALMRIAATDLDERGRVVEMFLCESRRVTLKPWTLYRFKVNPMCQECVRLAEEAEG